MHVTVCKPVGRCCSYTSNSTCSTMGPSVRLCECRNARQQCTVCYCWGPCKKSGWLVPSLTTARGLLGHFPHGADPPATDQRASPSPVKLPTYLSLRAIPSAKERGGVARGGVGGCRSLRDIGGGGRGAGGGIRNGRGETSSKTGAANRKTMPTNMTVAWASERRHGPQSQVSNDRAWGGVLRRGNRPGGERRRKRRVEWRGYGGVSNGERG